MATALLNTPIHIAKRELRCITGELGGILNEHLDGIEFDDLLLRWNDDDFEPLNYLPALLAVDQQTLHLILHAAVRCAAGIRAAEQEQGAAARLLRVVNEWSDSMDTHASDYRAEASADGMTQADRQWRDRVANAYETARKTLRRRIDEAG